MVYSYLFFDFFKKQTLQYDTFQAYTKWNNVLTLHEASI